ncbi:MAG: methylenetetrahydromethanopterin dehydrogenase, partial [Gemmataceae bacterium]|nr:methylenetetrahydromethanopterin dehydrogenase [Gemmataceae bacterium]
MSDKPRILIQLDTDRQASVFDRVVAVDAGCEHLFCYAGVTPDQVTSLIHGAIFTRGPQDLHRTAVFIGGSDVAAGELLLEAVRRAMLPDWGLRVSVLLDANGCNTTASAAVRAAARHLALTGTPALVLGGTGPVGQRVARLLVREGAVVRVGSRQLARAEAVCDALRSRGGPGQLIPTSTSSADELARAVEGQALIIAAGAAGVNLLPRAAWP